MIDNTVNNLESYLKLKPEEDRIRIVKSLQVELEGGSPSEYYSEREALKGFLLCYCKDKNEKKQVLEMLKDKLETTLKLPVVVNPDSPKTTLKIPYYSSPVQEHKTQPTTLRISSRDSGGSISPLLSESSPIIKREMERGAIRSQTIQLFSRREKVETKRSFDFTSFRSVNAGYFRGNFERNYGSFNLSVMERY